MWLNVAQFVGCTLSPIGHPLTRWTLPNNGPAPLQRIHGSPKPDAPELSLEASSNKAYPREATSRGEETAESDSMRTPAE